jgi:MFS family permease
VLPDLKPTPEAAAARFDGWGAVTLGAGAVSLLLAINRGSKIGWSQPLVVAGFVAAPLLLAAFVMIERRVAHPLLPLRYLRRRNFTFPIATQFFTNFAYMGAFAITPLLLQGEFGFGETRTTLLSVPRPLVFAIAGPVAGYFTLRIGERVAGVAGAVSIVASMVFLSALAPGDGTFPIIFALGLSGLGMGTASPALAAAIANSVDEGDLGIAGATQQMVSQVGVAMGTQVLLAIQTARESAVGSVNAYGEAYLVGGGMAVIGIVLATFVRRTPRPPARATGAPEGARAHAGEKPAGVAEPARAGEAALATR